MSTTVTTRKGRLSKFNSPEERQEFRKQYMKDYMTKNKEKQVAYLAVRNRTRRIDRSITKMRKTPDETIAAIKGLIEIDPDMASQIRELLCSLDQGNEYEEKEE